MKKVDPKLLKKAQTITNRFIKKYKDNDAFFHYTHQDFKKAIKAISLKALSTYRLRDGNLNTFLNNYIIKRLSVDPELLEEATPIINKIARVKKKNDCFAYYTEDDIHQEVWILCLDALKRYKSTIAKLENFLNNHVTNRIKNLKRDKYFRPDAQVSETGPARTRMNLVNALPIGDGDLIENNGSLLSGSKMSIDPSKHLIADELSDYILNRLSPDLAISFYLVTHGNKLRKPMLEELQVAVRDILKEKKNG